MKIGWALSFVYVLWAIGLPLALGVLDASAAEKTGVVVGSKKFTESVVLSELVRQALQSAGVPTEHKAEFGGTRILWNALRSGDIDIYPEYSGTIEEELLQAKTENFEDLRARLATLGIGVTAPLGFNNTYAVGMKKARAHQLGIARISDLAAHPEIKIGWGDEFRLRKDGWPGLKARYQLPQEVSKGLDHDIAYRALETGDIELTDLYSTDAEIQYYDLKVLEDDRQYFPKYDALYVYRLDTARRRPQLREVLDRFAGKISAEDMIGLNRQAKIDKVPAAEVASQFLREHLGINFENQASGRAARVAARTLEHLKLVLCSLLAAIAVAIPLGIVAAKRERVGKFVLGLTGAIQTIPALALLVILIRPLNWLGISGIGDPPALIALFLYSLLPIVRSTHTGFQQIPRALQETALVLGLSRRTRLLQVELPLALPAILSGIKTSAVMNVGFATLGALIGAGGYGQPILTGIRLDDYALILEGAIPSAVLALLVQQLFDGLEQIVISPGLRK